MTAKELVAACKGRLHDGKAGRILGLYSRKPKGFAEALSQEFPGLDDELSADILAALSSKPKKTTKEKDKPSGKE